MKVKVLIFAIAILLCGSALSQKQGQKCTGPHENSHICAACDGTCPALSKKACNVACMINGYCGCESGYCRCFKNKLCETPERCEKLTCPGDNKQLDECNPCDHKCTQIGVPIACAEYCVEGGSCGCKDGFYRNAKEECVSEEECNRELCPKEHEVYFQNLCQAACGQPIPFCPANPPAGCGCKKGYCRCGENGPCQTPARCKEMSESTSCTSSSLNE